MDLRSLVLSQFEVAEGEFSAMSTYLHKVMSIRTALLNVMPT